MQDPTYGESIVKKQATFVTWSFHVDKSAKGRHYMILGRDLLTASGLNI